MNGIFHQEKKIKNNTGLTHLESPKNHFKTNFVFHPPPPYFYFFPLTGGGADEKRSLF